MSRLLVISRRLAFGLAAIALTAGLSGGARAEVAYAFATETITGLQGTPNGEGVTLNLDFPGIFFDTNASAGLNGVNVATEAPLDAPIAVVGAGPVVNNTPSPGLLGNFFAKFATFTSNPALAGELPLTPAASFGRGDVLISGFPNTPSSLGAVVGEAYVNGAGQKAFGQGQNQISVGFTLSGPAGTSTVNIDFDYANDIYTVVQNLLGDKAQANFKFSISIADDDNQIVFESSPTQTRSDLKSPPNGNEIVRSGHLTVLTTPLTIGQHYNLSFSLQAGANVTTAVPEPATMAMALTALPLVGFGLLRRRNRNRQARA